MKYAMCLLPMVCAAGLSMAQPVQVIVRSDGSVELMQKAESDRTEFVK